jgi:ABC-2 type transport system permease protein
VFLLVVFTSVPLLFMTGVSWPQSNIPGIWQGIAMLFPSTYGVRGFLGISSMGASLSDIEPQFQALWIQTLVYFLLTCVVYRYQINSTRAHAIENVRRLKQTAHEAAEENRKIEKDHQ